VDVLVTAEGTLLRQTYQSLVTEGDILWGALFTLLLRNRLYEVILSSTQK